MNRFDLFTWRGEPVLCPNCEPDHRMAIDPSHNALLCTRCDLRISMAALQNSGEKQLTIEVLDRILQNEAHKRATEW